MHELLHVGEFGLPLCLLHFASDYYLTKLLLDDNWVKKQLRHLQVDRVVDLSEGLLLFPNQSQEYFQKGQ